MKRCSRVPVYRISVTSWNSRNIQARRMLRGSMQNVQQVFPRISAFSVCVKGLPSPHRRAPMRIGYVEVESSGQRTQAPCSQRAPGRAASGKRSTEAGCCRPPVALAAPSPFLGCPGSMRSGPTRARSRCMEESDCDLSSSE